MKGEGQGRLAGREIAGYRLLHLLGAGGASEVYLAQRLDDPSVLVAMKALRVFPGLAPAAAETIEARFLREAEAASHLQHPHILPVLAYGRDSGVDYMALPFMPGGTLVARINSYTRGMPLTLAADLLNQIAAALDYAHDHGIVHRDVKPANVLLDSEDHALLSDFGIARVFESNGQGAFSTLTIEGQLLGTPAYMAPEQVEGPRVSPQADIYALGVTLYQMVTGALPFDADTPVALAMRRLQSEPPPPRRDRAELPAPAQAAILRALALRPQDRFPTAGALARAFDAGIRGQWAPEEALDPAPTPNMTAALHSGASTVAATPPSIAVRRGETGEAPSSRAALPVDESAWRRQNAPTTPDTVQRRGASRGAPALWTLLGAFLAIVAVATGAIFSNWAPLVVTLGRTGLLGASATSTVPLSPAATATVDQAIAMCRSAPGFSAPQAPATAGPSFPDVPFPTRAVSGSSQLFTDGAYRFTVLAVCAPSASPSSVQGFYALAMPSNGWSLSATYPYGGNPTRACGDSYCWVKGLSPRRYVSLERVTASGALAVYELRLGQLA